MPAEVAHVWLWFAELSRGRASGLGASRIGWPDIEAWARLTQTRPTLFELSLIYDLDGALLSTTADGDA